MALRVSDEDRKQDHALVEAKRAALACSGIPNSTRYAEEPKPNYKRDAEFKKYGVTMESFKLYGRRIGPKLKARLEQLADESANQYDVSSEILHMRETHAVNLERYDAVMEVLSNIVARTPLEQQQKQATMQLAGEILRESAKQVIEGVEKAAKIQALMADKYGPEVLQSMTKQISQFVYRIFDDGTPDGHERIMKFDQALTDELQLASIAKLGTHITPDQQVLAMDDSVPSAPDME